MEEFYWLHQIQASDRGQVGDKAFYLSQLMQEDYPVIPGFVVPAWFLREFLRTIDWLEPLFADLASSSLHLDLTNSRQLQGIAQNIRQGIAKTNLPINWSATLNANIQALQSPALILRPTFVMQETSSNRLLPLWGLIEPYTCWANQEAVLMGLKQTWAKFFRARSLLCYQHYGLPLDKLSLAVLIQPLSSAIASGLLQTDGNTIAIQSVWGLGMALSYGEVLPDCYQVNCKTGRLEAFYPGSRNYAYRINTIDSDNSQLGTNLPCLQSYIPDLEHQRDSLAATHLDQLLHLSQRLSASLHRPFTLKWSITEPSLAPPSLYLTQLTCGIGNGLEAQPSSLPLPATLLQTTAPQLEPPLLKGVTVSAGQVLAKAYVADLSQMPQSIAPGMILVVPTLTPDWLPIVKQAVGLIAEQGGVTSHGAIIARELGIPAIVGASQATQRLHTDELILLSGETGHVYTAHSQAVRVMPTLERTSLPNLRQIAAPTSTQLMVNLSQIDSVEEISQTFVDGIGLLRSELMLIDLLEGQHPNNWIQQGKGDQLVQRMAERLQTFSQAFSPRPIFYRSLDFRSHEFSTLQGAGSPFKESNPMLGMRGTFAYQTDSTLLDLELTVIRQVYQSGLTNVRLILPFVRTVEEVVFCQQHIKQIGLFNYPEFQLWIMAEVPSILFLLPELVEAGVQGISIGSNDLTQLLLGVDRDQEQMAAAFDSNHVAVRRAIEQLVRTAHQLGLPCSICGQAPVQHPELIHELVNWGITSISVEPFAIEQTYRAIAQAEQHRSAKAHPFRS